MSALNEDRTTWGRAMGESASETTLYLVRHGETKWNVEGRVQGQQHAPFSDRGWDQTRRIAHRLASTKFQAVYTSDLQRAYEAAELIAASHQLEALRKIVIAHPGKTVAVITHGGPTKSAVYDILRIPISLWNLTFIGNGSITVLRGTQDVLRVVTFNDCSHLEGAITLTEPQ